ncbi:PTS sugar transporter subunit IIC [Suttonella sp. R2A3]|uniref:PTS transporter subunit IIC n=1 Tax=Suttonella sp. R2A3 TaxID=2908648 RepID=UPI001F3F7149|nr:PTS sugar transporter subunit IIC [Suttonella sp. R2A3]UJF25355.1 PTS sugar transporter subunit IIC [Suttonella sp. R2A3]UJF25358.1 PTS sugar transporter subunit IIC [Suttonella sp. R2A3]UJF25361.1 PTS sugar transporter subunit IIC [Suttonella sp. R2A3]
MAIQTKAFLHKYFITALSGMAAGLFVTLIAGLIMSQIGAWFGWELFVLIGKWAGVMMGAGIGVGIAVYLGAPPLVALCCLVTGMMGAHSELLVGGTLFVRDLENLPPMLRALPGNPIGAYLTAVFSYRLGAWLHGKTRLDILLLPLAMFSMALLICWTLCPPVVAAINALGQAIHYATSLQPFLMGVVISVVVGILLTLPTSSAAMCIAIGLDGLAGGAAVVGCAAHMVGFAVASFRENGISGLISQGLGTSMLQIPNVMRKPIIMLPAIVASAIVGPLATVVFALQCSALGSGMGTAGLVGVFAVIDANAGVLSVMTIWMAIVLLMFILPALIAGLMRAWMSRRGWIVQGDMALDGV